MLLLWALLEALLHCFQKKTEKTSKADVDLATMRYRDLLKELGL